MPSPSNGTRAGDRVLQKGMEDKAKGRVVESSRFLSLLSLSLPLLPKRAAFSRSKKYLKITPHSQYIPSPTPTRKKGKNGLNGRGTARIDPPPNRTTPTERARPLRSSLPFQHPRCSPLTPPLSCTPLISMTSSSALPLPITTTSSVLQLQHHRRRSTSPPPTIPPPPRTSSPSRPPPRTGTDLPRPRVTVLLLLRRVDCPRRMRSLG